MEPIFGKGAISESVWGEIFAVIKSYDVQSILEIGSGSSTVLFSRHAKFVTSLETSKEWINKVSSPEMKNVRLLQYVYPNFPNEACGCYDMAFVDGPAGKSDGRLHSMRFAAMNSDLILIHDSCRALEKDSIKKVFIDGLWTSTYAPGGLTIAVRNLSGLHPYKR
jgi:hypothetical protein